MNCHKHTKNPQIYSIINISKCKSITLFILQLQTLREGFYSVSNNCNRVLSFSRTKLLSLHLPTFIESRTPSEQEMLPIP